METSLQVARVAKHVVEQKKLEMPAMTPKHSLQCCLSESAGMRKGSAKPQ